MNKFGNAQYNLMVLELISLIITCFIGYLIQNYFERKHGDLGAGAVALIYLMALIFFVVAIILGIAGHFIFGLDFKM